jgi:hypothetical protein
MPNVTPEALREFANALYQRRGEGVRLRIARPVVDGWQPIIHECYENVDSWIRLRPDHKRIDGFIYYDQLTEFGFAKFTAHCVVEDENGVLADITPHGATNEYLFIRHTGNREEFNALAELGEFTLSLI